MSQPAISQQIRELSESCGLPLVVQRGRATAPTPLGEELAKIGRRLRVEGERATKLVGEYRSGTGGRLTVAASLTTGASLVPMALVRLRATHPGLAVALRIENTAEVVDDSVEELVDIGVIEGPVKRAELLVTPFYHDVLQCLVPESHPLARRSVPASALLGETLILREPGSGTRDVVLQALRESGIAFERTLEIGSAEAIRVAVASGLGITWASPLTAGQARALAPVDVVDLRIERTMSVIRRRDLAPTPAAEAFVEALSHVALDTGSAP